MQHMNCKMDTPLGVIPINQRSYEWCCYYVRKCDGKSLKDVPEEFVTRDLCLDAISNNKYAIAYVPKKYLDYNFLLDALVANPDVFEFYFNDNIVNRDLMYHAVKLDGLMLRYYSRFVVKETVNNAPYEEGKRKIYEDILACYLRKLFIAAVSQNGMALKFVPKEYHTLELHLIAVQQNPYALMLIQEPSEMVCAEAVSKNEKLMCFIPDEFKTPAFYLTAVQQNWRVLEYIPEESRTDNMCNAAVLGNGAALEFVPKNMRTYNLCSIAVQTCESALKFVPQKLLKTSLCMEAVKAHASAIKFVPYKIAKYDFLMEAVNHNHEVLQHIHEASRVKELCIEAVKKNKASIKFVPSHLRDQELFEAIFSVEGKLPTSILDEVPANILKDVFASFEKCI